MCFRCCCLPVKNVFKNSWQIDLVMLILMILSKQDILILDRTYSSAGVGPDLSTGNVQGQDEEGKGNLGTQIQGAQVGIQRSDEGKDNHEELKKGN